MSLGRGTTLPNLFAYRMIGSTYRGIEIPFLDWELHIGTNRNIVPTDFNGALVDVEPYTTSTGSLKSFRWVGGGVYGTIEAFNAKIQGAIGATPVTCQIMYSTTLMLSQTGNFRANATISLPFPPSNSDWSTFGSYAAKIFNGTPGVGSIIRVDRATLWNPYGDLLGGSLTGSSVLGSISTHVFNFVNTLGKAFSPTVFRVSGSSAQDQDPYHVEVFTASRYIGTFDYLSTLSKDSEAWPTLSNGDTYGATVHMEF